MHGNPAGVDAGLFIKSWLVSAKNYIEVTKPRSVFLLVFTALGTMFLAAAEYGLSMPVFIKSLLAITFACSGVNAVSCYVDRDIDAIMERTKHRPIPSGRITPPVKALVWGLAQFLVALAIAYSLNLASFVCIILGMLGYVGIYSLWFKRISAWNIILGGFSGGLPALFGWTAVTGRVETLPILISLLVVLWIPNHIWNLAIFYRNDYRNVGVPMLPVVCDVKRTLLYIFITVLAMFALSIAVYLTGGMGTIYLVTAIVCGLAVTVGNLYLFFGPDHKHAWFLYKLSSPYLFLLFLGMMLDRYIKY
ncbi:MAG TPA: protoheme IX farnesyltransferase [Desulfotomaculum sp.]|nr:MAG: protoheme IX farnesyltransferase [Desulfotomaculum sp. BICA1-6]HBX23151.1 protoheme IX farnesyltransferase [Desulfotomaculum sp.]